MFHICSIYSVQTLYFLLMYILLIEGLPKCNVTNTDSVDSSKNIILTL